MVRALEWVGIDKGMYLDRSQSLYVLCVVSIFYERRITNASEKVFEEEERTSLLTVFTWETRLNSMMSGIFCRRGVTNVSKDARWKNEVIPK